MMMLMACTKYQYMSTINQSSFNHIYMQWYKGYCHFFCSISIPSLIFDIFESMRLPLLTLLNVLSVCLQLTCFLFSNRRKTSYISLLLHKVDCYHHKCTKKTILGHYRHRQRQFADWFFWTFETKTKTSLSPCKIEISIFFYGIWFIIVY
jgi:hypothetical protein